MPGACCTSSRHERRRSSSPGFGDRRKEILKDIAVITKGHIISAELGISLEKDCLTVKAEKKQEEVPEGANFYSCERCFGDYSRSIPLPFRVDAERVSASFENGLLEIRLPKAEEARAKHIEVKVK